MDRMRIERFLEAARSVAASLNETPFREITLVHHNDTDGITAGAILAAALMRAGFSVEHIPIERVHRVFLPAIHRPGRRLILYADLGGQAADTICRHIREDSRVIIIDHHLPAPGVFPRLEQVNPELFGISGDGECAAAAAACFFALALDGANEDQAALAVLGAVGDHQMTGGRCDGLNALLLDKAVQRGDLRPSPSDGDVSWCIPRFQDRTLGEADALISDLAVHGYYRRGADAALRACKDGPDAPALAFRAEMAAIQRDRFSREMARVRREGLSGKGLIVWTHVGERFHPLGVKAIGLFCEEIIRQSAVEGERYLVGFQRFHGVNPYLEGSVKGEVKASLRVTPALRLSIERGDRPDLMELVPGAARQVGGFAEGCHRFTAACTIPEQRAEDFVRLLADHAPA